MEISRIFRRKEPIINSHAAVAKSMGHLWRNCTSKDEYKKECQEMRKRFFDLHNPLKQNL